MIAWPQILLWLVILWAALRRGPALLLLFSATSVFGGMTMLPASVTGGANLLPQSLCAALLVGKTLLNRRRLAAALALLADLRAFGFLFLFWLYGAISALFLPRLFDGQVQVVPLNDVAGLQPLHAGTGNVTQLAYLTLSFGIGLVFAVLGRNPAFRALYLRSILAMAALLVASGIVDLGLSTAGLSALLTPFHNAGYILLTDTTLGGAKRVVGFMPEASAYGGACCATAAFLVFLYPYFASPRWPVAVLIAATVLLTVLSTSSAGYAGLLVLAALVAARFVIRAARSRRAAARAAALAGGVALAAAALAVVAVLAFPGEIAFYRALLNVTLFDKAASPSYLERHSWTQEGWAAFAATSGIGVGIGSVRTSNWYVNILASTGVLGAALFLLFLAQAGLAVLRCGKRDRGFVAALLLALAPPAVMIGLAGTTPDPGLWQMAILGLVVGVDRQRRRDALGDVGVAHQPVI